MSLAAFALQSPIDDKHRWPTFAIGLDGGISVEGIIYADLVNDIGEKKFNANKLTVPSLQKLNPNFR